jgi:type II secretory pathway pseudopilin PulG
MRRLEKIKKNPGFRPAFTLVEIVVVLFIISVGLIGILSLIVQNIQSQDYNKNNLIAYQLSQEGMELVRMVRDTNWKNSRPFNESLASASGTVYTYSMDYQDLVPQSVVSPVALKKDANGFYIHGVGEDSGFSRLLSLELISDHSLRVQSSVFWKNRGRDYSYVLETILYDWY